MVVPVRIELTLGPDLGRTVYKAVDTSNYMTGPKVVHPYKRRSSRFPNARLLARIDICLPPTFLHKWLHGAAKIGREDEDRTRKGWRF